MPTTLRPFDFDSDILRICDFLSSSYQPGNRDGNWIRPIWDWSVVREDREALSKIGVWENNGNIVAATIFTPGRVCLCAGPDHQDLKNDMREYAEKHLATEGDGKRTINIYAYDFDTNQEKMLEGAGYTRNADKDKSLGMMQIPNPFPELVLPEGFLFKLCSTKTISGRFTVSSIVASTIRESPQRRRLKAGDSYRAIPTSGGTVM